MARVYSFLMKNPKHDNDLRGGAVRKYCMPLKDLVSEHRELVKVLKEGKPKPLAAMAKRQSKEYQHYKQMSKGMSGGSKRREAYGDLEEPHPADKFLSEAIQNKIREKADAEKRKRVDAAIEANPRTQAMAAAAAAAVKGKSTGMGRSRRHSVSSSSSSSDEEDESLVKMAMKFLASRSGKMKGGMYKNKAGESTFRQQQDYTARYNKDDFDWLRKLAFQINDIRDKPITDLNTMANEMVKVIREDELPSHLANIWRDNGAFKASGQGISTLSLVKDMLALLREQ